MLPAQARAGATKPWCLPALIYVGCVDFTALDRYPSARQVPVSLGQCLRGTHRKVDHMVARRGHDPPARDLTTSLPLRRVFLDVEPGESINSQYASVGPAVSGETSGFELR